MKELILTCRIITPMFMGGASSEFAEISSKGLVSGMRFWYRALNPNLTVEQLKLGELKLFGGSYKVTENGNTKTISFKSKIRINIESLGVESSNSNLPLGKTMENWRINDGRKKVVDLLNYVSYGVAERGVVTQPYFKVDSVFTIKLSWLDFELNERNIKDLLNYIKCIGCISGLGSKALNGFGRFEIVNVSKPDYGSSIINEDFLISILRGGTIRKPYPAISDQMKLFKLQNDFPSWDIALTRTIKSIKMGRIDIEGLHKYQYRQFLGLPLKKDTNNLNGLMTEEPDRYPKPIYTIITKNANIFNTYILIMPIIFNLVKKRDPIETYDTEYMNSIQRLVTIFEGNQYEDEVPENWNYDSLNSINL